MPALFLFLVWSSGQRERTFTVVIDAGHGGKDLIATQYCYWWKVINLSVAFAEGEKDSANRRCKVIYTHQVVSFHKNWMNIANLYANRNKGWPVYLDTHKLR